PECGDRRVSCLDLGIKGCQRLPPQDKSTAMSEKPISLLRQHMTKTHQTAGRFYPRANYGAFNQFRLSRCSARHHQDHNNYSTQHATFIKNSHDGVQRTCLRLDEQPETVFGSVRSSFQSSRIGWHVQRLSRELIAPELLVYFFCHA